MLSGDVPGELFHGMAQKLFSRLREPGSVFQAASRR